MTEGYPQKQYSQPIKRYCRKLDLENNPELIREYRKMHSEEYIWKEIVEGNRQVGILEMEIYITGNHLFMIVDTPLDFKWEEAMAKIATLPRQREWELFMSKFQICDPNSTADERWVMMERMFHLY